MDLKCCSILVIEDDAAINDVVCSALKGEGYECVSAYSGTEARLLLQAEPLACPFDLVICDLMLPGMSGEEVVAFIRVQSNVPILVISAKAEVVDRVSLLKQGVDDYLVKPFDLDELVARVEALLRRSGVVKASHVSKSDIDKSCTGDIYAGEDNLGEGDQRERASSNYQERMASNWPERSIGNWQERTSNNQQEKVANNWPERTANNQQACAITFGKWLLDEEQRRFEVQGVPVRLTRTEFDIVAALMRYPRKVFTKRELYEAVWHEESFVEEKAINTHISNIRTKLKGTGTESYIETVWGIGFKLSDTLLDA